MKQNINIEAEGLELILKNKAGDYVIIPKKYRTEVQGMIKDGCYSCIDKVVETLPVMNDYAEDGSLFPDWNKVKATLNPKNWEGAYFDDNQLLKLNPNNKNFDTLALQRELRNRGYKLPKSTKEDGGFDGIWGDETKNALLDYQTKNKPVMNNYAEGDPLITKDKKKITLEHRPYTAVQSSTYVAPKGTIPLELKGKQQFNPREQPVFRADTRTERERKVNQEYTESVLNSVEKYKKPLHWIAGSELLRWTANPLKGVGDIVSFVAPNSALAKDLPNTDEDVLEHKKIQLSPYISRKEKLNNTINEASNLGINSLINAATMELGFVLPKAFVSPAMTNMFREGSKAGFAADFLQLLTKTDFDKISDGDMNEIANLILTNSSLFSKMYNFDASTVYHNIKNWKSLSNASKSPLNNIINNNGVYTINGVSGMSFNNIQAATKYLKEFKTDTYKDIFNISQSINQQTQRENEN